MNITRKLWSRTFNCSVTCSDTVSVVAVSVFILFLPVVFYLSSFLHSEQKKRKLILRKFLSEVIHVFSQGPIGKRLRGDGAGRTVSKLLPVCTRPWVQPSAPTMT